MATFINSNTITTLAALSSLTQHTAYAGATVFGL